MFSEQTWHMIEVALTEDVEPRKVAAYLCLHMGLMLAEVTALQRSDIDLDRSVVILRSTVNSTGALSPLDDVRTLPMPPHVARYLRRNQNLYCSNQSFVLTGGTIVPPFYHMQNLLTAIAARCKLGRTLSASDLRNTFIRRCIQAGMDLYSLCTYVGIKQPNVIAKRFSVYFEAKLDWVNALEQYSADFLPPPPALEFAGPKRMNLLILGAGSQGPVVREIAVAMGAFHEIAFLDDNLELPLSMGPLSACKRLVNHYPMAIPSFGNCYLRKTWMDFLETCGYIVPTLVHPSAMISSGAQIDRSVVIEARCIVSSGAVLGRGALVSSGSVIEVSAQVGCFAHIGCAVTVAKGAAVEQYTHAPSGTVVRASTPVPAMIDQ